jgi:hypothetical protein
VRTSRLAVLALAVLACNKLAPSLDVGAFPVALDDRFQIAAPAQAQPPALTPCPPGWREEDAGSTSVCQPWPPSGAASCPQGLAQFPGDPQCAAVGGACPSGPWPEGLPQGRPVLYVLAGADGGSGTQDAPFAQLSEALAVATPMTVVALGPGTYSASAPLPAQVALWGACVTQTTLTADAGVPVVSVGEMGVEVHNLLVSGGSIGLYVSGAQAALDVEGVVVVGAQQAGWSVENGASSTGKNVVVARTDSFGIQALTGGSIDATRVVVEENRELGAGAIGTGSRLSLTDVAIHDTNSRASDGVAGYGAGVDQGGALTLTRAVIERSHDTGLLVIGGGAVTVTDLVVRDTHVKDSDGSAGYGVLVIGSTLKAQRMLSEGNSVGAKVRDAPATVTLTDAVVRRSLVGSELGSGSGVEAITASTLVLERVLLDHNRVSGLSLGSAGTKVTATDVVSASTDTDAMGKGGWGIAVLQGGQLDAVRVRLESNSWVAMSTAASTVLNALDLVVVATRPTGSVGAGLLFQDGSAVTLRRAAVTRNSAIGLIESGAGTTLDVQDLVVEQTLPDLDGLEGEGIILFGGAVLTGQHVRITQNETVGLYADELGTRVDLSQVEVSGVTQPPCPGHPMCDGLQPTGVLVADGASIKLDQFLITRNGGIGAQIADGGQLDLHDGEISHHLIGVNIDGDYDVSRISDGVQYIDDATKLGAMIVPLPKKPGL